VITNNQSMQKNTIFILVVMSYDTLPRLDAEQGSGEEQTKTYLNTTREYRSHWRSYAPKTLASNSGFAWGWAKRAASVSIVKSYL